MKKLFITLLALTFALMPTFAFANDELVDGEDFECTYEDPLTNQDELDTEELQNDESGESSDELPLLEEASLEESEAEEIPEVEDSDTEVPEKADKYQQVAELFKQSISEGKTSVYIGNYKISYMDDDLVFDALCDAGILSEEMGILIISEGGIITYLELESYDEGYDDETFEDLECEESKEFFTPEEETSDDTIAESEIDNENCLPYEEGSTSSATGGLLLSASLALAGICKFFQAIL